MDWTTLQDSAAWLWLDAHQDWLGPLIAGIAFIESFALIGIIVPGVVLLYITAFLAGSGAAPSSTPKARPAPQRASVLRSVLSWTTSSKPVAMTAAT